MQGTGTEVESEGHECIELPIGKRHGDKAQDGAFGGLRVLAQQVGKLYTGKDLTQYIESSNSTVSHHLANYDWRCRIIKFIFSIAYNMNDAKKAD